MAALRCKLVQTLLLAGWLYIRLGEVRAETRLNDAAVKATIDAVPAGLAEKEDAGSATD